MLPCALPGAPRALNLVGVRAVELAETTRTICRQPQCVISKRHRGRG
jgi:hypothetical protein